METFVGIDVSKDRLDVHLRPSGESFALARAGEAIPSLLDPPQCGLRPSARAGEALAGPVERLRALAASLTGKLAKTDRLDAAAIAHFAQAIRPPARSVPDAAAQALGELVARRQQTGKAGTGRLHAQAPRHPQLYPARPKTVENRLPGKAVAQDDVLS